MAFPSTPVLDNFNRSNENPLSGSGDWDGPLRGDGGVELQLLSNAVESAVSEQRGSSYWVASFTADQEVYADIAGLEQVMGIYARCTNPGGGSLDGYGLVISSLSGPNNIALNRIDDASETVLGSAFSASLTIGEAVGLELVGTTITVYHRGAGGWSSLGSRTDGTYNNAGVIGIDSAAFGTGNKIDNFGGGAHVADGGGGGGGAVKRETIGIPIGIGI